jgi:NAD-dependent deacetylase
LKITIAVQKEHRRQRMSTLSEIKEIIDSAERIVFFGGAGVSVDSGIPDFRSGDGLYSKDNGDVAPETILSHGFLMNYPDEFYRYYRENMLYPFAEPNYVHRTLANLEREGKLRCIITQNIDGLHGKAGSKNVIELHGSVAKNYCVCCTKEYNLQHILDSSGTPRCSCGGFVRPDVVMYGEALPSEAFAYAEEVISEADVLIVGGTSLTVNPAASLVECYGGEHLIIINKSPTPYDEYAEYVIRGSLADAFEKIFD